MIIVSSYDDHHIIIRQKRPYICHILEKDGSQGYQVEVWYSGLSFWSYHHLFAKMRGLKVIKYDILVCHSCHMMIIILSYDDHHQTEKTQHMLYFQKGGDSMISNMMFQSVILVVRWSSNRPIYYTFPSEFCTVVRCLVSSQNFLLASCNSQVVSCPCSMFSPDGRR